MSNNFFKYGYLFFFIMLIFITICICVFTPILSTNSSIQLITNSNKIYNITDEFAWPIPTSSYISSYFGYRTSPTWGASTYHSGIDIPASEGSGIIAVMSGTVVFTGFYGSGGCTIMVQSDNYLIVYSHVSPNYLVSVGQSVIKGQLIATVGPKNVYGIINNKYKDSNGNPTNGATTGPHLHLTIKKDGIAVNPLNYISFSSLTQ